MSAQRAALPAANLLSRFWRKELSFFREIFIGRFA